MWSVVPVRCVIASNGVGKLVPLGAAWTWLIRCLIRWAASFISSVCFICFSECTEDLSRQRRAQTFLWSECLRIEFDEIQHEANVIWIFATFLKNVTSVNFRSWGWFAKWPKPMSKTGVEWAQQRDLVSICFRRSAETKRASASLASCVLVLLSAFQWHRNGFHSEDSVRAFCTSFSSDCALRTWGRVEYGWIWLNMVECLFKVGSEMPGCRVHRCATTLIPVLALKKTMQRWAGCCTNPCVSLIKIHSRFKLQGPEEHLYAASPPALWQATRSYANKSSATHLHKSEIATKHQYVFCAVVNSVGMEFGYAWAYYLYIIYLIIFVSICGAISSWAASQPAGV